MDYNFSSSNWTNVPVGLEFQDLTIESGTYAMENMELNFTGKMTVTNDATLKVRNTTLVLTTRGETFYREAIVLRDKSRFIAENATIIFKSVNAIEDSYITVGDEALVNITDSELNGLAFIIGEQNSRTYINRSTLRNPSPTGTLDYFGVSARDNSTARIQNSKLDVAGAGDNASAYILNSDLMAGGIFGGDGNSLIEIRNSIVGTVQWLRDNCTLRISNSTIEVIGFEGSVLHVEDSGITLVLRVYGDSTALLKSTSVKYVQAYDRSQVWLINSAAKDIRTLDEGKVYVGWQLPLFGTISFPHTWLPILLVLAFLLALSLIIALLVFLNRQWKRWQTKKLRQQAESRLTQPSVDL